MTKRRTAEARSRAIAEKYRVLFDSLPVDEAAIKALFVEDIQKAIEAHAKAEVKHVTKNWDHGL